MLVINANTTYYIVVDGYGSESGNYELTVESAEPPPPPPAIGGYVVYRDGEVAGTTVGVEATMFVDEDLEDLNNPGELYLQFHIRYLHIMRHLT